MNTDDRPAGSQPPQGQPPPQQGYQQPPPQQSYQQPPPQRQGPSMPDMGNMANMGKGNPYLVNPDVKLNSLERLTVLLIRLVAWIALILLIIRVCGGGIDSLMNSNGSFGLIWRAFLNYLAEFAGGAIAAVSLLALASIVESLATMRSNRS